MNDNAYKIDISGDYNVSATFNVVDLTPYVPVDGDVVDSQSSPFQAGEDDTDQELIVDVPSQLYDDPLGDLVDHP